jgi:hypothetical protein
VVRQGETQGPINRMTDADPGGYENFRGQIAIVTNLQWRAGIDEIEAIMTQPGEPKGLAQPAWTGGQ